ncbi:MAG: MBL fold metallo-hydrolase [Chitinophagales bacterium]|nr:MBL fold metallo-hydrolase [Chitinophagaceae bacterium]MCB9063737.1 MBL fold metallo-hydrolase [Chitinophagales bacterium]
MNTVPVGAQPTSISNNINKAYEVLTDAYKEMNYNNTVGDMRMVASGGYYHTGHYDQPGSTKEYKMVSHILVARSGDKVVRRDTFSRMGSEVVSYYDIDGTSLEVKEANEKVEVSKYDKEKYTYKSALLSPNLLLQLALNNASNNSYVASDKKHHIIRHNNASGDVFYMYINTTTYFLDKVEQPMYDKVTGDYFITTTFEEYDVHDGFQIPTVINTMNMRDSSYIYKLHVSVKSIFPGLISSDVSLNKQEVGEWLYSIPLTKWNTKAVVADLNDYLVVFDIPDGPEAGYALLDYLKKAFHNKEVRYCIISHHHPDHMGGIRPFMESGATIVTTKGNKELIDEIAVNKHMNGADVRVKKPITAKYLFIDYKYDLRASGRTINIYPINRKSSHTDEYLISYIPSDRILIEGDLVKAWDLRDERKPTDRESSLIEYVSDNKIYPKYILQTWPLENSPKLIEYELLVPGSSNKLKHTSKKILDVFKGE